MPTKPDPDRPVEDLIGEYPSLVKFLIEKGLPCVVCGEPFWGSLRELAETNGWSREEFESLLTDFAAISEMPTD